MGLVGGMHLVGRVVGGDERWRGLLRGAFRRRFVVCIVDGLRNDLVWGAGVVVKSACVDKYEMGMMAGWLRLLCRCRGLAIGILASPNRNSHLEQLH